MRLGATPRGELTEFLVWAPKCHDITIDVAAPQPRQLPLAPIGNHYFAGSAPLRTGTRYFVRPDDRQPFPDPASRFQPEGVHGPSEIVDPAFGWNDTGWRGRPLEDYIVYELHIGTFTPDGTFDAAIAHLDELVRLGVTAVELMPVAQFPGVRNWGYDGVQLFAVQNSYGGPAGLKRLVNACHVRGLAVILDVVYNHVGPEGNYLGEFAPYFTGKYKTPWGPAVNVDGAHSDGVRRFFIENALEWVTDYHIDALRLDAVHGILDTSAQPFLAELSQAVAGRARELGREVVLFAESDLNDVRMIRPVSEGGMGMHAQWMDDFHHSLHTLLTGESDGYYADYGRVAHLAESWRHGYVFRGQYSRYRQRRHGNQPAGARDVQFCVCAQNHDQVGNRMRGERLAALVDLERLKLAAATVLLSPFTPLLFMGEEYGESQPFPYFIDHSDADLIEAVRQGRKEEFAAFAWQEEPPDPYAQETFDSARLRRPQAPANNAMRAYYSHLIALRKRLGLNRGAWQDRQVVGHDEAAVLVVQTDRLCLVLGFSDQPQHIPLALAAGSWCKQLSSRAPQWRGPGDNLPEHLTESPQTELVLPGPIALLYSRAA